MAQQLLLVALVGMNLRREWLFHVSRFNLAPLILLFAHGQWSIVEAGVSSPAIRINGSVSVPGLIILRFRHNAWQRPTGLVLLADSADPTELRRLRVLLRLNGGC